MRPRSESAPPGQGPKTTTRETAEGAGAVQSPRKGVGVCAWGGIQTGSECGDNCSREKSSFEDRRPEGGGESSGAAAVLPGVPSSRRWVRAEQLSRTGRAAALLHI